MNKNLLIKAGRAFLVNFLFTFMLLIFGPAEIFFANVTEFDFVYGEFAGCMAVFALVGAALLTVISAILPDKFYRIFLSAMFAIAVAGYLQVMFLNKHLDLLGVNPEGYQVNVGQAAGNLLIWLVVIALVIFSAFWKKDMWKKVVTYLSAFLLCIQLIAFVSLTVTAKEDAYEYPEGSYHLSGEDQYKVSADKNVIVLVLDYFSNQYLKPLETAYPGATQFLHDFTYYSNADCTYYGTFPSLPHMLTGNEVDMSCGCNEWFEQIWNSKKTQEFYSMLKEKHYVTNVYTQDMHVLCGQDGAVIMKDAISNVVNEAQEIDVSHGLLYKTMGKMSAYRMFPDILKPYFYANIDEYKDIVSVKENPVRHNNYDFYQGLLEEGLSVDKQSNYYIVQHLMGPHLLTTDENGYYKEDATLEETTKGCMVIVEEYLKQLKDLGVYDDATIIITADHGGPSDSQVIFYMKEPGETHEVSMVTNAPISHREFLPTIAEAVGADYTEYGQSVHDFTEDEQRERTVWVRAWHDDLPAVLYFTGDKQGTMNAYDGYSYTGDIEDLLQQIEAGPSIVVPVVDSLY